MESHEKLEVEFTERIDFPFGPAYAVACNSGTAALHLAIEGLLLPKGSQVIVPEYTMVAVARARILVACTIWLSGAAGNSSSAVRCSSYRTEDTEPRSVLGSALASYPDTLSDTEPDSVLGAG